MSASSAASADAPVEQPRLVSPTTPLWIGAGFAVLTLAGLFVSGASSVAMSWLVAVTFWTAITIGVLLLVMIHHIFDAGWSTVIRRPLEHWLAAFPWLGLLFAPLVIGSAIRPDLVWRWMNVHLPSIAGDVLYEKKAGFLSFGAFTVATVLFFAIWTWLSFRLRKHSFAQDDDGSPEHTRSNRKTAAFGIPLTALSLTFAAFYWIMSLEYHWFSTMFGVWFFSGSIRAALAFITLICLYLTSRGVLRGIFNTSHLLNLGNVMLAFTVFWAYISFSQYFLIWNANVPEETFWFNLREFNPTTGVQNSWWWVGLTLLFGHFFLPFLFFLQYPLKKKHGPMIFICVWLLLVQLLDFIYNIVPAKKLPSGDPAPFGVSPWDVTALLAVGGVCLWAFFNSLGRARCIPIRDPRIAESLHLHE